MPPVATYCGHIITAIITVCLQNMQILKDGLYKSLVFNLPSVALLFFRRNDPPLCVITQDSMTVEDIGEYFTQSRCLKYN